MDKYGFYNMAIKNLGLGGSYALSSRKFTGIRDSDIASIEAEAEALYKRYLANEIELKKQQKTRKIIEKINEISMLGGDAAELKDKLQSSTPIFSLVIEKDKILEKYNRTFFESRGTPVVKDDGIVFDGKSYYRLSNRVKISEKSFKINALIKILEVKKHNYFFGDGGRSANKSLHIGFRSDNLFTVDFWADGMNLEIEQKKGELYDVEFFFDSDTKEGVLTVNGKSKKHTFKNLLKEGASFIGKAEAGNFNGELYSLCVENYSA